MFNSMTQPMYIKGDYQLIAKYNRFDESVEIGDLNNPSDGWVTYDPTQGASSDELTEICNSLYDRCLLAELGVNGPSTVTHWSPKLSSKISLIDIYI